MKLTCLILDDEAFAAERLREYVARIPTLELKATFTNPDLAVAYLATEKIGLVFLDIEMPNYQIDGLDFVRLAGGQPHFIFVTAHSKYALSSYDYNAIDFLEKPVRFDRFAIAVAKAMQVLNPTDTEQPDPYTYVRVEGSFQRIDYGDLLWVESERNGIWLHTETQRLNTPLSISEIETRLPKQHFVRLHRSYIISWAKASVIHKDHVVIERQGKVHEIPIGDAYRKDFVNRLENKINRKG